MAGIGFQLRRLQQRETVSSIVSAAGHAAVIAAGPWLFTILSLALITLVGEQIAGLDTLATFRASIIYAFAGSLVVTAPVTIVATRLVADALWGKRTDEVPALLLGSYLTAVLLLTPLTLLMCLYFATPPRLAAPLVATTNIVGLIWIALSFCGAVRDYWAVTASFAVGLFVSLLASVGAAIYGLGAAGMIGGFLLGLATTLVGLTLRVLATFPAPLRDPLAGIAALAEGLGRYTPLAAGALAGTAGVWVDKWVFWFSPESETVKGGLVHAPLYDSAMFIASLVIIPSLAALVTRLETDFFDRYQHYYATIQSHGTLNQIEDSRQRLSGYTLDNLVLITVAQVGICAVIVLTAPLIIQMLGLQFRQIAILRFGALGAVFQFVFIAATSMLLFFDRRRTYLWLQVVFLSLNAGLTIVTVRLGEDYYGVGYFLACLISSFLAYRLADRTFERLNYLTFIANNPSILDATRAKGRAAQIIAGTIARWRIRPTATPR